MKIFEPSQASASALRADMDAALWSSVRSVLAGLGESVEGTAALKKRAQPGDYAAYADLIFDSPKGGPLPHSVREQAALTLRQRLLNTIERSDKGISLPRIACLDDAFFSTLEIERMKRWWDTEDFNPMGLAAVDGPTFEAARSHIRKAFAIMEQADPKLYGETLEIVADIVLVRPDGSQRFNYFAGSSFAVWGSALFNVDLHRDWTRYYKNIAHESGHNLLFAAARDSELVSNQPTEAQKSPVRDDPRPVDGIYHAAFVAARESRALNCLLTWHDQTGELLAEELEAIEDILEQSVITFWQCEEALERYAALTDLGKRILGECRDYMRSHFELLTD